MSIVVLLVLVTCCRLRGCRAPVAREGRERIGLTDQASQLGERITLGRLRRCLVAGAVVAVVRTI